MLMSDCISRSRRCISVTKAISSSLVFRTPSALRLGSVMSRITAIIILSFPELIGVSMILTGAVWMSQSLRMISMIVNDGLSIGAFLYFTSLLLPTFDTVADKSYPISRELYVYVKNAHVGVIPGIREFIAESVSERSMGEEGYLADKGQITLTPENQQAVATKAMSLTPMN